MGQKNVSKTKVRQKLGTSQSHVIPAIPVIQAIHVSDPWDILNNFCFHVLAQM